MVDLKILSWNIQFFSGVPRNVPFEPVFTNRIGSDYQKIVEVIREQDPDIVALQEVVDKQSMSVIEEKLPARYYVSSRMDQTLLRSEVDIFTAVGIDSSAFDESTFSTIEEMAFDTRNIGASSDDVFPFARAASVIDVTIASQKVAVISVHFESGCGRYASSPAEPGASLKCRIYTRQVLALAHWLEDNIEKYDFLAVSGDFNRPFHRIIANEERPFLLESLDAAVPSAYKVALFPDLTPPTCRYSTRSQFVDYFVVVSRVNYRGEFSEISLDRNDFDHGVTLSDHCPIILNIDFL